MKQTIDVRLFTQTDKGGWRAESGTRGVMRCEERQSARCEISGEPGRVADADWSAMKYLYLDLTSREAEFASPVLNLEFWRAGNEDSDEPDLTVRMTCLPRVKTRMVMPLSALDAQHIFLRRTPGRFRGFVTGEGVEPGSIGKFAIGLREYWSSQEVLIEDVTLSDEEPDYPLTDGVMVDELGQWTVRDWPGKTRSFDELNDRLRKQLAEAVEAPSMAGCSAWGGWTDKRFRATGFFRVENDGRRWWLVDPDGFAFFSTGVDGCGPNIDCPAQPIAKWFAYLPPETGEFRECWESPFPWIKEPSVDFLKLNFKRVFGEGWREKWAKITRSLFYQWGFNTLGNFSEMEAMPGKKLPYVYQLHTFPDTQRRVYRDFPDVFSEEYGEASRRYARELASLKDDPYLIGYFMRNEPQWGFAEGLEISAELLRNPDETLACKRAMIEWLRAKYATPQALSAAWGMEITSFERLLRPVEAPETEAGKADLDAFSAEMIRQYIRVPAQALRAEDPNHLNLGMRYAFILYPNQAAGCEYMDVFSINCYKIDPGEVLAHVAGIVRMPVLIGEFHFGSIDRGLGSTGIIGVETQKDRGLAYQRYLEACAGNDCCVGAHWFTLYDQSCMGRMDGENYQIGLLDVCNRPYEDFISGVTHTHERLYPLLEGLVPPERPEPKAAKSNIAS